MKPIPLLDPHGRRVLQISRPIPGRPVPLVLVQRPDGRAYLVDLNTCHPVDDPALAQPRSNP